MKTEEIKTQVELYICNHARENKEACAGHGAEALTDTLKKWTKENYKGEIKVVRSGCLGQCERGIAMASYPRHEFLLDVKPSEMDEVKEYLKLKLSQARA